MKKKFLADIKYLICALSPFSSRIRMKIEPNGLRLYAYKWDVIGRHIFKFGQYDPFLSNWLIGQYRETGGNFIDIGANLGYYTCLLGELAGPAGLVLSVEPEPNNLKLLNANIAINSLTEKIKVFPVALGAKIGTATLNLYKSSNRGRHSIVSKGTAGTVEVSVRKLDDLANSIFHSGQRIDFLKMDVEGYEPFVIQGGLETLDRVDNMVMEYAPFLLKNSDADLKNFLSTLYEIFPNIYVIEKSSMSRITMEQVLEKNESIDLFFQK
jgi:FkbM family methyltransferase